MVAPRARDAAVALAGGVVVIVLLRPTSGQDSMPPRCWNALGREVPCEGSSLWPAVAVAVLLFLVMWLVTARQAATSPRS